MQLLYDAVEGTRDLDRRLVRLHLANLVELLDACTGLHEPLDELAFRDAFADVCEEKGLDRGKTK